MINQFNVFQAFAIRPTGRIFTYELYEVIEWLLYTHLIISIISFFQGQLNNLDSFEVGSETKVMVN